MAHLHCQILQHCRQQNMRVTVVKVVLTLAPWAAQQSLGPIPRSQGEYSLAAVPGSFDDVTGCNLFQRI